MHMKIKQKKLKQMLDVHRHLTNEIKIKFKEAGASVTSVDCAHREMVHTLLKKDACEEYNLHDTGDLEIGIDIYKLIDFLKLGKSEEIFTFDYDIESNRLVCKLGYLIRTMGLLDIEGMLDPEMPVISMKNRFTVDTSVFNKSLKGVLPSKKESYLGRKTFITVKNDKVILENYDEDEEKNKEKKAIIYNDIDKLTISSGDGEFVVIDSDLFFDQVKEYKKILDDITVEMIDLEQPLRVTGENTEFNLEYWIAPITTDDIRDQHKAVEKSKKEVKPEMEIKEEIKTDIEHETFREDLEKDREKFEEDRDLDPLEQKDDYEMVKEEIEREQIANDIKSVVRPICKPKRQPYKKYQWSQDMEFIKDQLEKHRLNKETNKDKVKKTVEYKGFVFFINIPKTETELSCIKIKNKDGSEIIQQVLPDGYVLIAWYKWNSNGWIAQTVKKAI